MPATVEEQVSSPMSEGYIYIYIYIYMYIYIHIGVRMYRQVCHFLGIQSLIEGSRVRVQGREFWA